MVQSQVDIDSHTYSSLCVRGQRAGAKYAGNTPSLVAEQTGYNTGVYKKRCPV